MGGGAQRLERAFEVAADDASHLGDRDRPTELGAERRRACVRDAARHDGGVGIQVDVAVEREPVHRHPPRDAHADRCDLAVGCKEPHPGPAVDARRCDAHLCAGVDECLLEHADVGDDVDGLGEPDHGVSDELARTVPGDATTTVDVDDGSAVRGALPRGGALAGRVDRFVLDQENRVGHPPCSDGVERLALAVPGRHVRRERGAQLELDEVHEPRLVPAPGRVSCPPPCPGRTDHTEV